MEKFKLNLNTISVVSALAILILAAVIAYPGSKDAGAEDPFDLPLARASTVADFDLMVEMQSIEGVMKNLDIKPTKEEVEKKYEELKKMDADSIQEGNSTPIKSIEVREIILGKEKTMDYYKGFIFNQMIYDKIYSDKEKKFEKEYGKVEETTTMVDNAVNVYKENIKKVAASGQQIDKDKLLNKPEKELRRDAMESVIDSIAKQETENLIRDEQYKLILRETQGKDFLGKEQIEKQIGAENQDKGKVKENKTTNKSEKSKNK